ncbi:head maturation protease, ClpP-related [Pseudovibrio sp. Ad26]|uniref:head maturation protease, ClpP-related n=1 Tax=Pseudovibrio sp. Ad26 TaxID=989410 RepID=UPI0007AE84A9|nr:head maturation protease, ClpP-related [Pseudovibrio sp. Ad26]KZL10707.1 ATP-dependent Clp protease proteolytic subunit [Pseudovibrio sp. Ad26]
MGIYRDGQIFLYGFVGDSWWDEGFTTMEVIEALAEHGRDEDVTVRMDSGGGYAMEGLSTYNALKAHGGKVTLQVDAMSGSAASLIAMAADEVVMKQGALMMIHDPSGIAWGTAEEHEKSAKLLNMQATEFAKIYASFSGKDADEVRGLMKVETWMTGEDAVEQGFASSHEAGVQSLMSCQPFDFTMYSKAPKELVTMTRSNKWDKEPETTPPTQEDGKHMPKTDEEIAQMVADAEARGKAEGAKEGAASYMKLQKQVMALPQAQTQPALAESFMADGMSFEAIKAKFDLMVSDEKPDDDGQDVDPQKYAEMRQNGAGLSGGGAPQKSSMNTRDVYRKRRERAVA